MRLILPRTGAYRAGADPAVDEAIHYHADLEGFFAQGIREQSSLADGFRDLAEIFADGGPS